MSDQQTAEVPAPELPYKPRDPERYRPNIALIGCGGITEWHLRAYKAAGYKVTMLCDPALDRAEKRRADYFPQAEVCADYRDVLAREDVEVVDLATHPAEREPIIEAALRARKHVLSQKPFVLDLDTGERFADLADEMGVKLAVNQNARWSPHFSYIRNAIEAGLLGEIASADFEVHWDHNWIAPTPFNSLHHVILYDFAVHWFDATQTFFGAREARRVFASVARSKGQRSTPPLLAHAVVDFDEGQATYVFNGDTPAAAREDRSAVIGDKGVIRSIGPSLFDQRVVLVTAEGVAHPKLEGSWLPDGMHGTMGELLCAIEEQREPSNSARNNLKSLEICFAAVASADSGHVETPGKIRRLPESCITRSGQG